MRRLNLTELKLPGLYQVEIDPVRDERGYFARAWCQREFSAAGIEASFVQASISHTIRRGTVRGMHYQLPPSREGKLVRCISGRIYDVAVDIRPDSPTFLEHVAVELDAKNSLALFIPTGFAHGFQTLVDSVDVFYEMTDVYEPKLAGGFRYDDPQVKIEFPLETAVIGHRDASYPDIEADQFSAFCR